MPLKRDVRLLQFRVLRLGLLQDGDVRVAVFPERKEILIRREGPGSVGLQGVGASKTEMGQRPQGKIHHTSGMIRQLLKLISRPGGLIKAEICLAAHIDWIKRAWL